MATGPIYAGEGVKRRDAVPIQQSVLVFGKIERPGKDKLSTLRRDMRHRSGARPPILWIICAEPSGTLPGIRRFA